MNKKYLCFIVLFNLMLILLNNFAYAQQDEPIICEVGAKICLEKAVGINCDTETEPTKPGQCMRIKTQGAQVLCSCKEIEEKKVSCPKDTSSNSCNKGQNIGDDCKNAAGNPGKCIYEGNGCSCKVVQTSIPPYLYPVEIPAPEFSLASIIIAIAVSLLSIFAIRKRF